MGYTNYLTVKSITKEQFDLLCDVSAEAFYMWQKRFVGATLTLAPNADDKSNILAILVHSSLERKTEREIVSDISKEWKKNRKIWIEFRDCEPICVVPDEEFIFCKTRQYEREDTLTVAIFWLAHLIAESATFGSDGDERETADGRAFAEYILRTREERKERRFF